ncbi:hypothetical protein [Paracoccus chinensis]|uniref:Uncharacterized protein n=1 Tax=Paracoccus chinensis TaxID=525640 RepID=A0A1G9FDX4_9RHOB|nr:hypothetical protein [Paracoccus chinensis]SDK86423.1 hypothetical protein SAMN04487971_103335 [Paracoccus chinensis]
MSLEERIIALEHELNDTRRAAVVLMLGIVDTIARSPKGREDMAQGFGGAAAEAAEVDPVMARLALLMSGVIWERANQAEDNE